MVALSKSKYCGLWQCPKIAWLRKNTPEALTLDGSVLSRMEAGNEVGARAMDEKHGYTYRQILAFYYTGAYVA